MVPLEDGELKHCMLRVLPAPPVPLSPPYSLDTTILKLGQLITLPRLQSVDM